jgi:hypothetical protein
MALDFTAIHIGTLLLAFIAGLAIVTISSNWVGRIVVLAAIVGLIAMGMTNGPSDHISNLTKNMADAFFYEPFGLVGAAIGLLIGIGIRKKI